MKIIKFISYLFVATLVAACGSSSDFKGGGDTTTPPPVSGTPDVASIVVNSSSPAIATDGSETAVITAIAKDANNILLEGVTVSFSTTSGGLNTASAVTDSNGEASATLSTAGDSSVRTITVTASSGSLTDSVNVGVEPSATPVITTIDVLTDPAQIGSDGSQTATITALVKDASNNFVSGVNVLFISDSGGVTTTQAVTDASGVARAVLSTAGDPLNREIIVTATAGGISGEVGVDVIGSSLQLSGSSNISLGDTSLLTIILNDSSGTGIAGQDITVSSANGNSLSAATVTTDNSGSATVELTAAQPGDDVITISGLGLETQLDVVVSSDEFNFIAPADLTEVVLNSSQVVTVELLSAGTGVPGETVTFSTTRGLFDGGVNTATTDASGQASVSLSSENAGPAVLTATTSTGLTTKLEIEFVATLPASIDVQASPFTVPVTETSAITAIVRDADNNLVKNTNVIFTLDDISGGSLSAGTAITDSQGSAQIFYQASETTSAKDGVVITATIDGTAIMDEVLLTVAGKEVFISLGTGNTVAALSASQYQVEYAIQVTDANGVGVPGVDVTLQLLPASPSKGYYKGWWFVNSLNEWEQNITTIPACENEDVNFNGILDPGEDFNANDQLDPGNKASVAPGTITTDASGFGYAFVTYPKEFSYWMDVTLQAQTSVSGTQFSESRTFVLKGLAADYENEDISPPGQVSPFGINSCSSPD